MHGMVVLKVIVGDIVEVLLNVLLEHGVIMEKMNINIVNKIKIV